MERHTMERITKGEGNAVIDSQWNLRCIHCGQSFKTPSTGPMPLWYLTAVCWGFAYEHAECEDESEDASNQNATSSENFCTGGSVKSESSEL